MLTIRRQRRAEKFDDNDRHLPQKLRKTYRDEDFLLHEDEQLIIFTTKTNLRYLFSSKINIASLTEHLR